MAKKYFEKIPFVGYAIDATGEIRVAVDILQRVKIRDSLKDSTLIYYEYDVKDGETPEIIAAKLYGWSGYHWIVLLVNDIIDPYTDWVQSYDNMTATIRKKYTTADRDGLEYAQSTVHHYEDVHGNYIDLYTFGTLPVAERTSVSIYDYEIGLNETKRHIKLLDKGFVDQIDSELDKIMKRALV